MLSHNNLVASIVFQLHARSLRNMQRQAYLCFIDLVVLFYPSLVRCSSSGDYKVLVWSNGPAIVGETTSFNAEAVLKPEARTRYDKNGNVTYEFSWKVPSQPWIKHQKTAKRSDSFRWRWTTEAGFKTVSVYVRILKNYNGRDSTHGRSFSSYYATNRMEVEVSGSEGTFWNLSIFKSESIEFIQLNEQYFIVVLFLFLLYHTVLAFASADEIVLIACVPILLGAF